MNITELARKLRVSTKELKVLLPELGFDIGQRAIKVDDTVAEQIIKNWRKLIAEYQAKLSLKKNAETIAAAAEAGKDLGPIELPSKIAVKDLAVKLGLPLSVIMRELMRNGIIVSLNEPLDFDTASIIAEDLGRKVLKKEMDGEEELSGSKHEKLKELVRDRIGAELKSRPPVIVIMGHVDHGKTKLLDTIRTTNIMEGESGGITQHIGAYQIEKNGKLLTFIDTPGHEAFTTMRTRGSRVADLAILVVAADDGVQPQTLEALRIIKNAGIPMIVAINKIDKPDANPEKTKQELAKENIISEEWGGKTMFAPISAKTGVGIDKLIDAIILIAETEEEKLLTDWGRLPVGTIIESHMDKSEGTVATILVQAGVLKNGNVVTIDNIFYGKIKMMKNHLNERIDEARPGTPVKVLGLKALPAVGDIIEVLESEKGLSRTVKRESREQFSTPPKMGEKVEETDTGTSLKLILKTDTLGSAEAIVESIAKINLPKSFKIDLISRGLGSISENDISRAKSAEAVVAGFNVRIPTTLISVIAEEKVEVKTFDVIYDLLDYVKAKIIEITKPTYTKRELGNVKILKLFKKTKKGHIIGGRITKGEITPKSFFTIKRKDVPIGDGIITEIQSGKETVRTAASGQECGISIESLITPEEGDMLEVWERVMEEIKF